MTADGWQGLDRRKRRPSKGPDLEPGRFWARRDDRERRGGHQGRDDLVRGGEVTDTLLAPVSTRRPYVPDSAGMGLKGPSAERYT